ncbi:FCD domain-containing protein [bacterium]|nr:FCD domain-containing protein [bacterium]
MTQIDVEQPDTLARKIYDGLCREITSGKLKPGTVLSRRKIAAAYGTSYVPVIEAMVRLEGTGLIETESSQMARVCRVTLESIQHTYVLREAFETQAIRLACEHATPQEIEELYQMAEDVQASVPQPETAADRQASEEGLRVHWLFHRRIAEISRCPLLVQELERAELHQRLRANWIYVPEMAEPPRQHAMLVDAIKAADVEAADAVMRAHVRLGLEKELHHYRLQSTRRQD